MNNYHSFSPRTASKWLLRKARGNFHHPPRARVDRRDIHFFFCSRIGGNEDFEITRARWNGVSVGRKDRRDWRQHLTYLSDRLGISSIKPSTYSWGGGFPKHREEGQNGAESPIRDISIVMITRFTIHGDSRASNSPLDVKRFPLGRSILPAVVLPSKNIGPVGRSIYTWAWSVGIQ